MTQLLEKALNEVAKLPPAEQGAPAKLAKEALAEDRPR